MEWLGIILLCILLLLLVIVSTKLTVIIHYSHLSSDIFIVELKIWFGLIKFKRSIPLGSSEMKNTQEHVSETIQEIDEDPVAEHHENDNDNLSPMEKIKDMLEQIKHLHIIIRKFFKKIKIKRFDWETMIGMGDAAATGVTTGALWTLKGMILSILSHYFRLMVTPAISIHPHFQAMVFQSRFTCMFQFRIGHAMLAGLQLFKFWKSTKKHSKNKTSFSNDKINSI